MSALAPTLQAFFTDRLARQRRASPRTVAAYRDTFRLLLGYASRQVGTPPGGLDIADLDATMIGAFLDHLEHDRGNSPRTRNARLAAIRSLFGYASTRHPEHAADIARVLAIPQKRFDKTTVSFLTRDEINALRAAPDPGRWEGRRDRVLLAVAVQTGLRVSELTGQAHSVTGPPWYGTGRVVWSYTAYLLPPRPQAVLSTNTPATCQLLHPASLLSPTCFVLLRVDLGALQALDCRRRQLVSRS